jgi:hypothetical protein
LQMEPGSGTWITGGSIEIDGEGLILR